MVAGDGPRSAIRPTGWVLLLSSLAWPWLYLALLSASFILMVVGEGFRVGRQTKMDFLLPSIALLSASFLMSVVFSQVPSLSAYAFGCFLLIVGFCLVVAQILEDEAAFVEAWTVIATAVLFLAVRVIVWRVDEGLNIAAYHIRNNAWLGKLQIAWVLNLFAPLLLARFMSERATVKSALNGITWVLSGTAIHLLFSRMGSLTFAVTTLSVCLINPSYWRRWITLLAAFTGVTLVLIVHSAAMPTHVVSTLIRFDQDASFVIHQGVWREAVRMFLDHPVTGIGLGTYDDVAYSQYQTGGDRHFFRNGWNANNVFLHFLAETGTLGILAWCYLWYAILRFLLRTWRDGDARGRLNSSAVLCALLAFFILSLTEALIGARVHASLRMNLTIGLLVVYGIRLASSMRTRGSCDA